MSEIKLPLDAESYITTLVHKGYTRENINTEFNKKYHQYMKSPQASKINPEMIVEQVFYATFSDLNKYEPPLPVDFVFVGHGTVAQKDGNPWCTGVVYVNSKEAPLRTIDGNDQYRKALESMIPMTQYNGKLVQRRGSMDFMFTSNCEANPIGPYAPDIDPFKNLDACLSAMKILKMTVAQASAYRSKTDTRGRPELTDLVAIIGNISRPTVFAIKEKDDGIKEKKYRKQVVLRDGTPHTSGRCDILDKTVIGDVKPLSAWVHPQFIEGLNPNGIYGFLGNITSADETNRSGSTTGKKIASMNCIAIITLIGPPPEPDLFEG